MDQPSAKYGPDCPYEVERASMLHRWDRISFLHWAYEPAAVQRLLPAGLEVETFDGRAWVGLIPFFMEVRPSWGWRLPWLLEFPETNVRTYVRGPHGDTGVWFFSLDATRLAAVVTARSTYRVPYFWSQMTVERTERIMDYSTLRRWPGPRGAHSRIQVEIGEPIAADELTAFEHYLTARFTLFGTWGNRLLKARAAHPPWDLHRAETRTYQDDLVQAAGLPQPTGPPITLWSPGTDVRVGFPMRTATSS